jgi:nicotinamidase-related amidase
MNAPVSIPINTPMTAPLTIPARPFAFALPPGRAALIVIDMQRDFIEPGGFGESLGNDVSLLRAAVAPTQALLSAWREKGWPVVHTRESHLPDLSDCPIAKRERGQPSLRIGDPGPMGRLLVRGEPGCEIVPELAPLPGEIVIDKPGKGAFHGTDLQATLQGLGVTHLVFAGVTTEVCVQTTMREANDRGYDSLLVEEATASYFPEFKAATLEMIVAQGGIVGWAAPLEAVLEAVLEALRPGAQRQEA